MTTHGLGVVTGQLPAPADGQPVHAILVAPNPLNTGTAYFRQGAIPMLAFVGGVGTPYIHTDLLESNNIDPTQFSADSLLISYLIR